MPRSIRPHAPGAAMHITARTQNGAHYFTEDLRNDVAEHLCEAATFCGSRVLALAIMPNHFHLVIKQGTHPLGWMMQRAMQRTVMLVRRHHGGEGHVFGRRYWSSVCLTPHYLRQAIVYTHLNPWKANLCADPARYRWSSCGVIAGRPRKTQWQQWLSREKTLLLFARDAFNETDMLSNYTAHAEYAAIKYKTAVPGDRFLFDWSQDRHRPRAPRGDEHWAAEYAQLPPVMQRPAEKRDVRDAAIAILKKMNAGMSLDTLRYGPRSRNVTRVRRDIIAVLRTSGYRGTAIARCLYVSQALVSDVGREIREARRPLVLSNGHEQNGQS